MINELGISLIEIQEAGDWSSLESVKSYAKAAISKKRELINRTKGTVIDFNTAKAESAEKT